MCRPDVRRTFLPTTGLGLSAFLHLVAVILLVATETGPGLDPNPAPQLFSLVVEPAAADQLPTHQVDRDVLSSAPLNADAVDTRTMQASGQTPARLDAAIAETVREGLSAPSARGRRAKSIGSAVSTRLNSELSVDSIFVTTAPVAISAAAGAEVKDPVGSPDGRYGIELLRHISRFVRDPTALIAGGAAMEPLRVTVLLDGRGNVAGLAADGEGSVLVASATLEKILRSAAPYPPPPDGRQTQLKLKLTRLQAPSTGVALSLQN